MDTIYSLLIVFVLYCIVSDWFMHEYGEKLSFKNFNKFKIDSFFSYQIQVLKSLKRLVNLNEESLAKQPIFWIGIILPLIIASWVEYHIILLNLGFFSFEKIDKFYEASKPALYITALTPTLGILISNIHRTIQSASQAKRTEKQIKIAEDQFNIVKAKNNQDLFYSHNKYITERIKPLKKQEKININEITEFFEDFYGDMEIKDLTNSNDITIKILNENALYNSMFIIERKNGDFNASISYDFIFQLEKAIDDFSVLLNNFHISSLIYHPNKKDNFILLRSNKESFSPKSFCIRFFKMIEIFEGLLNIEISYDKNRFWDFLHETKLLEKNNGILVNRMNATFEEDYINELCEFIVLYNIFYCIVNSLSNLIEDIYDLLDVNNTYELHKNDLLDIKIECDRHNWFETKFIEFHYKFYELNNEIIN